TCALPIFSTSSPTRAPVLPSAGGIDTSTSARATVPNSPRLPDSPVSRLRTFPVAPVRARVFVVAMIDSLSHRRLTPGSGRGPPRQPCRLGSHPAATQLLGLVAIPAPAPPQDVPERETTCEHEPENRDETHRSPHVTRLDPSWKGP